MKPQHKAYLDQYLSLLSEQEREAIPNVIAEYFCADEYNANECARLVNEGIKTATCGFKKAYLIENEPLPKIGTLMVVLNWEEEPVCIVRTTEVSICPFNKVSEEFAQAEGEGDGTYQWWYDAHLKFFTDYALELGTTFEDESELVLERFERVYPFPK